MTATVPAVYIDAQTREELWPPCDWVMRGNPSGAVTRECGAPAAFIRRSALSCGCSGTRLQCGPHATSIEAKNYCRHCRTFGHSVVSLTVEPLR